MAHKILGWEPTVSFAEMVKKMVSAQISHLKNVTLGSE
jgi:GDP-D-mannose dehydratase